MSCVVLAAAVLLVTPPPPSSASVAEGNPTLAAALGSSLPDVGTAASLVAAGYANAVIFAESTDSLGDAP